jgi:hypothetical protein
VVEFFGITTDRVDTRENRPHETLVVVVLDVDDAFFGL